MSKLEVCIGRPIIRIEKQVDKKIIHIIGYGYYESCRTDKPYRFVKYEDLRTTMRLARDNGLHNFVKSTAKHEIVKCDGGELVGIYESFAGAIPSMIKVSDLCDQIPDGNYIVV